MHLPGWLSALLSGMLLAACATAQVDQAQLSVVRSVFIEPIKQPQIRMLSGLYDWAPSGGPSLHDLLTARSLDLATETRTALASAFAGDGYEVSKSAAAADATVNVEITWANYFANPPIVGGGCTPTALFDISMKAKQTGTTIFRREYRLQNGGNAGITGHVILPSDAKYELADCGALWTQPDVPIEAFRAAITMFKNAVAAEVTRR